MTNFLIIVCDECSGLLIANSKQQTRTCPYCGFKVILKKSNHVATAETAYEISIILKELKMKLARNSDY